ncbi:SHOCT domain-containing protein [Natrinema versiforme]|uniref:SHOCT domain-containing protein n=1 Tax=Natrinema versiforme JCM 10478 TaxID=1227496 RepID=L9XVU4_9EURY|nr:SHOCT domain-containing protein [Natrinema versiforme]ELY65521.1 hypothetical protein C489_14625 [Natrinema versiforme JCM 10478]
MSTDDSSDGEASPLESLLARTADETRGTIDIDGAIGERLEGDAAVRHVLRGRIVDYETDTDDRDAREDSRTRKVVSPGVDLLTLVTDEGLIVVVQRPEGVDHEFLSIPYASLTNAALETAAGNRRLVVRGSNRYYVDVGKSSEAACTDALAHVRERIAAGDEPSSEPATSGEDAAADPLETLERLADLRDRGALTDEEFASKKRELLERL